MIEHDTLLDYDAPEIVYHDGSYYLRFNDPKEFLDVPGYSGPWQNINGLERDRKIHIIHAGGVNGHNLDFAPDWYPTNQQAVDFKDPETWKPIFGVEKGSSVSLDLQPGELILRDQRWHGTLSGRAGDRLVEVQLQPSDIPFRDKFITTFVDRPLDSGFVKAVHNTHIEVDLYEAGNYVQIGNQRYTVLHYRNGILYLDGDFSAIQVGQPINSYNGTRRIPLNAEDNDAFASGSILNMEGFSVEVLDHFPNACPSWLEDGKIRYTRDDPDSRFPTEFWADTTTLPTHLYLRTGLPVDCSEVPFYVVNKQWYVASCEVADLPEAYEPICWPVLRIGGADVPYRFRRFVFNDWKGQMLDGDLVYTYGEQVDPPFVDPRWQDDICPFPNWYQKMDGWATFTRILTTLGEFPDNQGDMFVCDLKGHPYFRSLPAVTQDGLQWQQWKQPLYAAEYNYI